jgi:hypothetical protein
MKTSLIDHFIIISKLVDLLSIYIRWQLIDVTQTHSNSTLLIIENVYVTFIN